MVDGPIMVVDDDVDIRETLADALTDMGFDVVTAGNGLEALELLRSLPIVPSIVLLDLMMPVMDGYGFLAERRKDPALAAIPVAIITAGHGIDHSRLVDGAPIVRKPFNVPQLVHVIDDLRAGPPS